MKREQSGSTTKKKIFFAAAELFAEKGYSGASMKEIAEKTGIKASSIYNHYTAKEQIMNDLLDYYLKRMEIFYKKMHETSIDISDQKDLGIALNKLMLSYEAEELKLMYCLTRIVHHEQFNFKNAAEAMIGSGYRKYVGAHIHYFDRLSDAGFIYGKERNKYYGEIYARLSLTFATQFLHPDIEPTIKNQNELSQFVNELVLSYEQNIVDKEDVNKIETDS